MYLHTPAPAVPLFPIYSNNCFWSSCCIRSWRTYVRQTYPRTTAGLPTYPWWSRWSTCVAVAERELAVSTKMSDFAVIKPHNIVVYTPFLFPPAHLLRCTYCVSASSASCFWSLPKEPWLNTSTRSPLLPFSLTFLTAAQLAGGGGGSARGARKIPVYILVWFSPAVAVRQNYHPRSRVPQTKKQYFSLRAVRSDNPRERARDRVKPINETTSGDIRWERHRSIGYVTCEPLKELTRERER